MKKPKPGRRTAPERRPLYKDPAAPVEARVKDLLSRMTLEEKAEQLCQDTIGKDPNPDNHGIPRDFNPRVGSVYQWMGGAKLRNRYQRVAVEKTRLGIPIMWAIDVIHGWRTMFPVSIAQAASFEPSLTEKAQRVAARECKADGGVDWLLGPMVEVGHDPRWGRNVEGYGEDPFTNGRFAAACVRGMQAGGETAACPKHFVGYSACEGGRDYSYTEFSARALREWYLPPFAAAAKAGALTVMSSFNEWDGKPVSANRALLTDELRGRMGFKGFVVSDSGALSRMGNLGYVHDPVEQAARAIRAGNEMSMGDGLNRNVPAAVAAGKLSMEEVDEAVARVLRVKFAIGLFERPYVPERPTRETCQLPDAIALAHKFARETMVLLKNGRGAPRRTAPVLPLDPRKIRALFGHHVTFAGMLLPGGQLGHFARAHLFQRFRNRHGILARVPHAGDPPDRVGMPLAHAASPEGIGFPLRQDALAVEPRQAEHPGIPSAGDQSGPARRAGGGIHRLKMRRDHRVGIKTIHSIIHLIYFFYLLWKIGC